MRQRVSSFLSRSARDELDSFLSQNNKEDLPWRNLYFCWLITSHVGERLIGTRYETLSTNLRVLCQIENIIYHVLRAKRYPSIATGDVYARF